MSWTLCQDRNEWSRGDADWFTLACQHPSPLWRTTFFGSGVLPEAEAKAAVAAAIQSHIVGWPTQTAQRLLGEMRQLRAARAKQEEALAAAGARTATAEKERHRPEILGSPDAAFLLRGFDEEEETGRRQASETKKVIDAIDRQLGEVSRKLDAEWAVLVNAAKAKAASEVKRKWEIAQAQFKKAFSALLDSLSVAYSEQQYAAGRGDVDQLLQRPTEPKQ